MEQETTAIAEDIILEGSISVKAALQAGRREIFEILTDGRKSDRNRNYILNLARHKQIKITETTQETISSLAGGCSHGGIVARVGEREYQDEEAVLSAPVPFLALLEGVEDPYNFGGALRSLYAAGVTGVFVPQRNWCSAAGLVTKASAGASEFVDIVAVSQWDEVLTKAKERGIRILCATRKDAKSVYESDLTGPILLVFGGEMRGISSKIMKYSDGNLFLPYGNDFRNALSANSAAAVFSFEAFRQRSREK
ncbi:MAG: RNA methyltransferase [Clostridia bacterium]|nr:RNA methyltransferase [Clostridia bacterium]